VINRKALLDSRPQEVQMIYAARAAIPRSAFIAAAISLFASGEAGAQSDKRDYAMFASRSGVEFGWRSWHELADQIVTEVKVANTNSYKVQVRFTPVFYCPNGEEKEQSGVQFVVRPGQTQAGNWSGLFWYPCEDGRRGPTRISINDLRVERVD
jgi:hypothetical protein